MSLISHISSNNFELTTYTCFNINLSLTFRDLVIYTTKQCQLLQQNEWVGGGVRGGDRWGWGSSLTFQDLVVVHNKVGPAESGTAE